MSEATPYKNLAEMAISSPEGDQAAMRHIVQAYQDFYVDFTFEGEIEGLDFRNFPVHKAIGELEDKESKESLTPQEASYLQILQKALEVQEELFDPENPVVVVPDSHHWDFEAQEDGYVFHHRESLSPIHAFEELRYAGVLSNPHDPTLPAFGEEFVLNSDRLSEQVDIVSEQTKLKRDSLLKTVFVNAAQVMGRRIAFGVPEGQVGPEVFDRLARIAADLGGVELDRQPSA